MTINLPINYYYYYTHCRLHIARDSITPDIDKSSGAAAIDDGGDGARADKEDDGGFGGFICDWCPARLVSRVRKLNLGCRFLASKVAFSWPSVDRFGKDFGGLMTLGQVESVPNFCYFGPQRAEKRNF